MALFENEAAGKTPSAKFPTVGTKVVGEIVRISEPMQARKYGTDEPDTWRTGRAKMQVCVTVNTGEIVDDPEKYPDHNGEWGLWVLNDFSSPEKTMFPDSLLHAIQKAVRAAGAQDLEPGGRLAVEYYGNDPDSKNPANPRKMYRAEYQKPKAGGGMFTEQAEQKPAAQAEQKPAGERPWTDAAADLTPDQRSRVQMMLDAEVTPERVAKAVGVSVEAVKAVADAQEPPF